MELRIKKKKCNTDTKRVAYHDVSGLEKTV